MGSYCGNCGATRLAGSAFCHECGARFDAETGTPPPRQLPIGSAPGGLQRQQEAPPASGTSLPLILGIALLVAIVVAGGFLSWILLVDRGGVLPAGNDPVAEECRSRGVEISDLPVSVEIDYQSADATQEFCVRTRSGAYITIDVDGFDDADTDLTVYGIDGSTLDYDDDTYGLDPHLALWLDEGTHRVSVSAVSSGSVAISYRFRAEQDENLHG